MEQQELLIRLDAQMQGLVKTVTQMELQLDKLNSAHDRDTMSRLSVAESKLGRLEWVVYGALALAASEFVALVFLLVKL